MSVEKINHFGKDASREAGNEDSDENRSKNMQEQNRIVEILDGLNFEDNESVLEWICDLRKAIGNYSISFDKSKVISKFKDHGFDINANIGEKFNKEDPENVAKWIVGQALDMINEGYEPHHMTIEEINKWKQKFGRQKQTDDRGIEELN